MTYPPYGGQENHGGYQPRPQTGDMPTVRYPASGVFAAQPSYGRVGVPAPPGPPRRNKTVLVLTIAIVALVLLAGTFTTLYVVESGNHGATSDTLQTRDKELADANTARKNTQAKLDDTDDKLKDTEKSRDKAKDEVADLTKCRDATRAFIDAVAANKEDASKEVRDLVDLCR